MPCNLRLDNGEDFEAEINVVMSDESDSSDRSDSERSGSDLDQLRSVLAVPGPDAQMHEVRKRQYLALSSVVPVCSRNRVLKKTSPLDSSINHQGQRYALYCQFWIANGLFPTMPQLDVNPRSTTRWTFPEAKLKGAMAELYLFIPKDLHHPMETYSRFASLFRAAVSSERSNILHSIKDCVGVIFSSFKLNPNLFADQPSKKQDNKDLLVLLKRNGEGDYICLAPILFAKPNAMAADDFLKSPVLTKIVHVEVFGKAILGGKTRGHPKGRGQCMSAQSISEVLLITHSQARFLLTHDAELTAIGAETKIDYQKDYNFYLEHLLKGTPWAISVMEYLNKEVFNTTTAPSAPTSTVLSAAVPHTWEDDFLQELDNLDPVTCDPSPTHSITRAPSPSLSTHSTLSMSVPTTSAVTRDDHSVSTTMNFTSSTQMSISQTCVTSASTPLHVDINQLSLADDDAPKYLLVRACVSAQAAQVPVAAPEVPLGAPKVKHVSARSKKATSNTFIVLSSRS
ncbi:hypothetical protein DFH29DRAFT_994647 [Suillus ampliporus]|nr:hypothetical protein DFH29DRAFT_994647 [Suillus ampliporus]